MADVNWMKELRKIELEWDAQQRGEPARTGPPRAPAPRTGPGPGAAAAARLTAAVRRESTALAVFSRMCLSIALAVSMLIWPYEARCGVGLAAYLAAVAVVIASGAWTMFWTWRHHSPKTHLLALFLLHWGLVLGALEVLPRIGYAKPTVQHPAMWRCR